MMRGTQQVSISQAELTILVKHYKDDSLRATLLDRLDSMFMSLEIKLTNIESPELYRSHLFESEDIDSV